MALIQKAPQSSGGFVQALGLIAATLTTASFAPQVMRTFQSRHQSISLPMLLMFGAGVVLWLIYGVT